MENNGMSTESESVASGPDLPGIRQIDPSGPVRWLRKGFDDLKANPLPSLFYGFVFVLMGHLMLRVLDEAVQMEFLIATAFLLLAPFLATGLYELSRMRESGEHVSLIASLTAWKRNPVSIGVFAAALGVITVVWIRLSSLLFAVLFIDHAAPGVGSSAADIFFSGAGLQFLVVFFLTGACVAAFVFAVSVVAVPMLLDRPVDFFTAAATSLKAVGQNIRTMVLWAALIAGITMIGLLPLFLGLAITVPVIGHASWHAYRDLVEQ